MDVIITSTIIITIAVYLIILALILNTSNFISAITFKVIPFFSGLFLLYSGLQMLGIIN